MIPRSILTNRSTKMQNSYVVDITRIALDNVIYLVSYACLEFRNLNLNYLRNTNCAIKLQSSYSSHLSLGYKHWQILCILGTSNEKNMHPRYLMFKIILRIRIPIQIASVLQCLPPPSYATAEATTKFLVETSPNSN